MRYVYTNRQSSSHRVSAALSRRNIWVVYKGALMSARMLLFTEMSMGLGPRLVLVQALLSSSIELGKIYTSPTTF